MTTVIGALDARVCIDRCFGQSAINSGRESILVELTFNPQDYSIVQWHTLGHFLERN